MKLFALVTIAALTTACSTNSSTLSADDSPADPSAPSEATITWENGELGISVLSNDGTTTDLYGDQMVYDHDWATVEDDKLYGSWDIGETSVNLRSFDGGNSYFGRLVFMQDFEATLVCDKADEDEELNEFKLDCHVPIASDDRQVDSFVAAMENGEAFVDIKLSDGTTFSPIGEEATGVVHSLEQAKAAWDMGEHWMDLRSIDNGQTFGGIFVFEQDFSYYMICKTEDLSEELAEYTLKCENAVDALATSPVERP